MSNFRVGQKVVCVDGGNPLCDGMSLAGGYPVTGGIYTVDGVTRDEMYDKTLLHLAEFPTTAIRRGGLRGWDVSRFRPAVDIEQDIALFHALCPGLPVVPPAVVPKRVPVPSPSD